MDEILLELYDLPKWKVQKEYIDNLKIEDSCSWLIKIDSFFTKIPTDRKDKFFYLIDKLSLNIKDIEFISKLSNIKDYILCTNLSNFNSKDILKYISDNKIYKYDLFNKIDFDIQNIKDILKGQNVINRDFLSQYIKNKL